MMTGNVIKDKLLTLAFVGLAAVFSGCAMCENCDDYGPPVMQESIEGFGSPSGRTGSVLSETTIVETQDSASPAGSGTRR